MRTTYQLTFVVVAVFLMAMSVSQFAYAQGKVNIDDGPIKEADWFVNPAGELNENHAGHKNWITKWYGPDGNFENNGGFGATARRDLIEEGTDGKLTQLTLSTPEGLKLTQTLDMEWPGGHGGTRGWEIFEFDPANSHHMDRDGPGDNIDTYAICVIDAPADREAVMSPAHDDHAQIWINGEKWYNNSAWTGGAETVDFNVQVQLQKGANVVLYRCGESGGDAYMNLHFDDDTHDAVDIYPNKANDQRSFFNEIQGVLAVDPVGKLTTTWGDIKRSR